MGKWENCSLLVRWHTGATTVEISVENPPEAKDKCTMCLLVICPKDSTPHSIGTWSTVFIAAVFRVDRNGNSFSVLQLMSGSCQRGTHDWVML